MYTYNQYIYWTNNNFWFQVLLTVLIRHCIWATIRTTTSMLFMTQLFYYCSIKTVMPLYYYVVWQWAISTTIWCISLCVFLFIQACGWSKFAWHWNWQFWSLAWTLGDFSNWFAILITPIKRSEFGDCIVHYKCFYSRPDSNVFVLLHYYKHIIDQLCQCHLIIN